MSTSAEFLNGAKSMSDWLIEQIETNDIKEIATLKALLIKHTKELANTKEDCYMMTSIEKEALKIVAETSCPYEKCSVDYDYDIICANYCANCWHNYLLNNNQNKKLEN